MPRAGLLTIPQIISTIVSFFVIIIGIRIFSPIVDVVLGLFSAGILKTALTMMVWLIYVIMVFITIGHFLEKKEAGF